MDDDVGGVGGWKWSELEFKYGEKQNGLYTPSVIYSLPSWQARRQCDAISEARCAVYPKVLWTAFQGCVLFLMVSGWLMLGT